MEFLTPFTLFFIGLLYIIALGALSLLRREGLSIRFAVESLLLIGLMGGLAFVTGFVIHPVLFLIILYLVTMRVRLLVDVGNSLATRGRFAAAERIYNLAERMGPDPVSRANLAINRGVARLQQGRVDEAIVLFRGILNTRSIASLGIKNEAACHYNLGVAYERQGQPKEAAQAFQAVLDAWPMSEYARRAAVALERQARSEKSISEQ